MSQTITRGQITFVDLNDGKNISLYLVSNRPLTQLYDVDTKQYAPDYETDNLVISPTLYVSDSGTNQIAHIAATPTWTINGAAASSFQSGVTVATTSPYTLTISKNAIVDSTFMTIQCSVSYVDPDTGLATPATAQITFTKTDTTGELIRAIAYANGTPIFYGGELDPTQEVTLHCDLWRGASIDDTDVDYQWFRKDNPDGAEDADWYKIVASYSGSGGAPATGTLPDGSTWCECLKHSITGYTTSDLTVTAGDVLNYDSFMCLCTDTDDGDSSTPASATYGQSVRSETIAILDWTDPYSIEFVTPAGTSITRGTQYIETTATIWQNGKEIAPSVQNSFYYLWKKMNKNGRQATGVKVPGQSEVDIDDYKASANSVGSNPPVADTNWSIQTVGGVSTYCRYARTTASASARQLTVYKDELSVKNTFSVEVIIP